MGLLKGYMEKIDALCQLVERLVKDRYSSPGSGHIFNDEINILLKEIQNDR
jgi:hypothetical protein